MLKVSKKLSCDKYSHQTELSRLGFDRYDYNSHLKMSNVYISVDLRAITVVGFGSKKLEI